MIQLKNPILLAVIFGLVSVLFSYLENRINNTGRTNSDYLKLFIMVSILVFSASSVMSNGGELASFKDQDILVGDPGF